MNNPWNHVEQLQNGVLNHAYQLQKRGHDTEGDGAIAQADASPYEGQQIAESEGTAHDDAGDDGEAGATHHIATQALLHGVETVGYPQLSTQRAQHGIMFHALLHLHLYLTFVLSDVEGHLAQASDNQLAEDDGQGGEHQQYPSQAGVEPAHQEEGATELYEGDDHLGHILRADGAHLLDVLAQS